MQSDKQQISDLLHRVAPVINGVRYDFPTPNTSTRERFRQRLTHFNQLNVYLRNCDATGKRMLSLFSPLVRFPVYDNEYWWSDAWESTEYGRDYDFNRPFFDQYLELRDRVPHIARAESNNENCDYCNNVDHNKDCYLIFNTTTAEGCMYGENVSYCRDCIDCTQCKRSELCYECTLCIDCYDVRYAENCTSCSESRFLRNCRSCKHCFGCVNLYRKEYCVFNKQLSKREYADYTARIDLSSYEQVHSFQAAYEKACRSFPIPHQISRQAENATGNILFNVKDVHDSYLIFDGAENLASCFNLEGPVKDCLEHNGFGLGCELMYQCVRCGLNCFGLSFCLQCAASSNLLYCSRLQESEHCFGCASMHRARYYCILNKPYTEKEYFKLLPRIIEHMKRTGEWGQFFPATHSAIPYNHSLAQRYFPITEASAVASGLLWYEREPLAQKNALPAANLPDRAPQQSENILSLSMGNGRPFLISTRELALYHERGIPLPRISYEERLERRAGLLGGIGLDEVRCEKSGQRLQSAYHDKSFSAVWEKSLFEKEFFG